MNYKIAPAKEPQFLFLLSLFAFLELFISGVVTLFITPDPKNAVIFGFSALRLVQVVVIWILAIIVLVAGVIARKNELSLDSAWLVNKSRNLRRAVYAISFAFIVLGWLALFCPAYMFGRLGSIFMRIQPFSVALGLSMAQSWLFFLFARGWPRFRIIGMPALKKYYKPILLFAVIMIGLGVFIASTKFGLLVHLTDAHVPGIPLAGLQWCFILLLVGVWIWLAPDQESDQPLLKIVKKYRLLPILIFLTAFLVWGLTPMLWHFFSLQPAPPSYQPFPFSDARTNDLGGISILRGYGIYFYSLTDKPLYLVFMAILHFFAGFNYTLMTWLQILVLAFIPVILFLLGKRFHSTIFGIFLSLVLIFRQRNSIVLSTTVSSTNPKLFLTEGMTLLGIALFAYLVFLWMRDPKIWLAVLCGGCIGATSLIRLNPLFLFPAIACLIVPTFWKMGKKFLFRHLSAYTLAFLILIIPWLIIGVNPQGTSWFLIKLQYVIQHRYGNVDSSLHSQVDPGLPGIEMAAINFGKSAVTTLQPSRLQDLAAIDFAEATFSQNTPSVSMMVDNASEGTVERFLDHLLHNFFTSVMSLPNSLRIDDLNHLTRTVYWNDGPRWQGNLPPIQTVLIFLNLVLIAIGLGYSWVHYRWAGMIPMTIFLAYSISLASAMNSGGRYIVTMDWVLYFYYGLAIIVIVEFINKVLAREDQSQQTVHLDFDSKRGIPDRRKFVFSLVGIIFLASLIPMANLVMPLVTVSARNRPDVLAAQKNLSAQAMPGTNIVYGEILYPYYVHDKLTFDFITPAGDTSYEIDVPQDSKLKLISGENAFIDLSKDLKENPQIEKIYMYQNEQPVLIWSLQP
ncbi:MAG: hypothetical protein WCE68_10295 [Anaerolineales bacterium]